MNGLDTFACQFLTPGLTVKNATQFLIDSRFSGESSTTESVLLFLVQPSSLGIYIYVCVCIIDYKWGSWLYNLDSSTMPASTNSPEYTNA